MSVLTAEELEQLAADLERLGEWHMRCADAARRGGLAEALAAAPVAAAIRSQRAMALFSGLDLQSARGEVALFTDVAFPIDGASS